MTILTLQLDATNSLKGEYFRRLDGRNNQHNSWECLYISFRSNKLFPGFFVFSGIVRKTFCLNLDYVFEICVIRIKVFPSGQNNNNNLHVLSQFV